MADTPKRRSKLQGDAPLTEWELEKVRRDADRAATQLGLRDNAERYLREYPLEETK